MSLAAGTRLGPYEILEPIGAGGMGEVYKARDTRLGREVAVKVSAEQFTERFDREARAIAALNHTNLCHLYDVGPNYLVMELVDGETLRGPLRFAEALPLIRQLIDGIEAAHERNIVHRDLKPANIKITPEGMVKILDFGLAKASAPEPEGTSENSPTMTMGVTTAGTILGTAAYMSPEQAKGKTADRRADIWSFGVVVYELLTGSKPFRGESVVETLGAVINQEPDWSAVPERMRRLLQWCLEKDRKQRLQAIGDARRLLEEEPESAATDARPSRFGLAATIAAAILAVGSGALGSMLWRATRPPDRPMVRLDVDLGAEVALPPVSAGVSTVALSPDGNRLAYAASIGNGPRKIFVRRLDQPHAVELPGTEGAEALFVSPDGQWIGFKAGTKFNKTLVEGGGTTLVGEAIGNFGGADWGEDGIFVGAIAGVAKGIARIPAGGGPPVTVTELAKGELFQVLPQALPGGKAVLFSTFGPGGGIANGVVEAVSLVDRRRKTVLQGLRAIYLPSGHLIYLDLNATLSAIAFDPGRLETHGNAVPILNQVSSDFSVSRSGALVYRSAVNLAASPPTRIIQWLDSTGKREPLLAKPASYGFVHISPDGKRLVLTIAEVGGKQDLWVYDQPRDTMLRLTTSGGPFLGADWTPDGRYIISSSLTSGIIWIRADGAAPPQTLIPLPPSGYLVPMSFTGDGKRLVYAVYSGASGELWTVPVEEAGGRLKAGTAESFLKGTGSASAATHFSPDGRWLAYTTDESGRNEVYVRSFRQSASGELSKWPISNSGGDFPVWSPNGRDLLYKSGDQIMAVSYTVKGDVFLPEKPRVWVSKLGTPANGPYFDLAPDGKRVAVIVSAQPEGLPKPDHEVTLVLNFMDEVRRRVPAGK